MDHHMEKPAGGSRAVPVVSLAAGKIDPDSTVILAKLQASNIARRFAVGFDLAEALAPLVFGEGA